MNIWIRNTDGKRDAVLTMTLMGFIVVLFKFLFAGVTVMGFSAGTIDASMIAAVLTPTLGAYVARRYTDKNMETVATRSSREFDDEGNPL